MILCHAIGRPVANGKPVKVDSDWLKVVELVENFQNYLGRTECIHRISTIRDEICSCLHKIDGDVVKQNSGSWTGSSPVHIGAIC